MPPLYRTPHLDSLIFHSQQETFGKPVGKAPAIWASQFQIGDIPEQALLADRPLTRQEVRMICTDTNRPALFGYVCAMAWGLQGSGPGAARHVQNAWGHRNLLNHRLQTLREGGLSRSAAYELFYGKNAIPGLGPSYLTKLLYFFSPEPSFYIMDQWTGKSIDLITGYWIVRMTGDAPSPQNKPGNYQAYCEEVDIIADYVGKAGKGEIVEEWLFSKGGRNPSGWRSYLKSQWDGHAPQHRYKAAEMHQRYPHIPLHLF